MRRSASAARGVRNVISAHASPPVEQRARERHRVVGIVDRDDRHDARGAQPIQSSSVVERGVMSSVTDSVS